MKITIHVTEEYGKEVSLAVRNFLEQYSANVIPVIEIDWDN